MLLICFGWAHTATADDAQQAGPQPLTSAERNAVMNIMAAFELRIDPEYYLSGENLKDVQSKTPESRRRRYQEIRRQQERLKQITRQQERAAAHKARQQHLAALHKREQEIRHAAWKAQQLLHLRHRCNTYQRNVAHARAQSTANPNYVYTPIPIPPGC